MNKITRYTTPTLTFSLPFESTYVKNAWVTISQVNHEITKTESDILKGDKYISCELTQEESGSLEANRETYIQVRVVGTDSKAYASEKFKISVDDVLKEGVIGE